MTWASSSTTPGVLRLGGFLLGELLFRALISTPVDGYFHYTPLWFSSLINPCARER